VIQVQNAGDFGGNFFQLGKKAALKLCGVTWNFRSSFCEICTITGDLLLCAAWSTGWIITVERGEKEPTAKPRFGQLAGFLRG